jgi:hypothetical protein
MALPFSFSRPAGAVLLLLLLPGPTSASEAPLQFRITEGEILNAFHQEDEVAAHLLLSSGTAPRVLVAFPAGNSGVGVWFERAEKPVAWALDDMKASVQADARARPMRGIIAEASVTANRLTVREGVVGSVRVLRDFQLGTAIPAAVSTTPQVSDHAVTWARPRIDGAAGYRISLEVLNGRIESASEPKSLALVADRGTVPLRLRITALTGEPPLTPFAADALLDTRANDDSRARQVLRFLSYQEKFLAGSWRFNTYFGRDTLMSLRLLMPALRAEAVEAGLVSVLERLNAGGEVAHEEDIGEFAVLRHRSARGPPGGAQDAPIHDYKMIDDDFMLAPVAAAWLLDHEEGRGRAQAFFARKLASGESVGSALARNAAFVLDVARAFAQESVPQNLASLKRGVAVGQWRDSEHGLAGGRYPYDVNAVWIPAALSAIARIQARGLFAAHAGADRQQAFAAAADWAKTWSAHAPGLFEVRLTREQAAEKVRAHAAKTGVDPTPALASLPPNSLHFAAVSLDAGRRPIPVLHSDVGFALLFSDPPAVSLDAMVATALRPFPAGLLTDVGMVSANPVYSDPSVQGLFGRNAYHGTGVWSWQQALMAAGLARQLQRGDLPAAVRARVKDAEDRLWRAIDASSAMRTSELWSWAVVDGRYRIVPFGQGKDDADESNAAQLWSTVYLAIPRPR